LAETCQSIAHFKTMMKQTHLPLILLMVFQLWGCDKEKEPSTEDNTKDREEMLINWVDNIVIPSYANFRTKLDAMTEDSEAFSADPNSTTLVEFRASWEQAYIEWQKVELFEFGAAEQYGLRNFYNIYPANVALINTYINDPLSNLDVPTAYPAQGFPALDYLINGIGADDAAILLAYTTDADAAKRLDYLAKLVWRMDNLLTSVTTEWSGSYRDTFISKTGLDINSSTGKVVNAYILEYERYMRSGKVGIPAGIFSSGVVQPEKVEAFYKKDISKILAQTAVQAAQDFFNGRSVLSGANGPSFKSYLDALGAKDDVSGDILSDVINNQFTSIKNELNGLGDDFTSEVQNNNTAMTDTYNEMQILVRLLKLDMTSAMSVTITYTDNDGD
jgi:predicted lipoprotein